MWKIIELKNWENIRNSFSWIRDMEGIPQDKIYHAEGNVAVHTEMVMNALLQLSEFTALEEQDQEILFAAALLHDVEKRSTTVLESNGRISSRNHARKGEYTVRTILYKEIKTPFAIKEAVAKLVRYHGLPLWIFDKRDPIKALLKASTEVNLKHLAMLSKADVLGRICDDQKDLLERVELFSAFCVEQQCFETEKQFASDLGRYLYFKKDNLTPDYQPYEEDCFEVVILSALPGTGKDRLIHQQFQDWPIVSLDEIRRALKILPTDKKGNGRVIQEAKEKARMHLRAKESFVWNATNITRKLRGQLIDLFQTYGAKTRLIYLEVPYDVLRKQNKNRDYPIPEKILEKMIQKLEVPAKWEAPIVDYL